MKSVEVEHIATGGFGRVEKLRVGDGFVARKVFCPQVEESTHERLRRRFVREVKTQRHLSEEAPEHFVAVLDSDMDSTPPWFTMPLADMNYEDKIRKDVRIQYVDPLPLFDILSAVEALHTLGYAHRDLKPSNILLIDGHWKLADFGLVLPPAETTTFATEASHFWTKSYSAPEQFTNFSQAGQPADIYSFGCILHDIIGGSNRVPGDEHRCDSVLSPLIERCTKKDPKRRFHSIAAVRDVLHGLIIDGHSLTTPYERGELRLPVGDRWDDRMVHALAQLIKDHMSPDADAYFRRLTSEDYIGLHDVGTEDDFATICQSFCDYCGSRDFEFAFCDVLIGRLATILELGSTTMKSEVICTSALLGAKHNRWYVMEHVLRMCNGSLDDGLARRVSIDLRARDLEDKFRLCATQVGKAISSYHPSITRALSPR